MTTETTKVTLGPWVLTPLDRQAAYELPCHCSVSLESRSFRGEYQTRVALRHCPTHAAAREMYASIDRDVRLCGCNSLPGGTAARAVKDGCGYCREKRALLRRIDEGIRR